MNSLPGKDDMAVTVCDGNIDEKSEGSPCSIHSNKLAFSYEESPEPDKLSLRQAIIP